MPEDVSNEDGRVGFSYVTETETVHKIEHKYIATDWNESDSESVSYIKNRTHFRGKNIKVTEASQNNFYHVSLYQDIDDEYIDNRIGSREHILKIAENRPINDVIYDYVHTDVGWGLDGQEGVMLPTTIGIRPKGSSYITTLPLVATGSRNHHTTFIFGDRYRASEADDTDDFGISVYWEQTNEFLIPSIDVLMRDDSFLLGNDIEIIVYPLKRLDEEYIPKSIARVDDVQSMIDEAFSRIVDGNEEEF